MDIIAHRGASHDAPENTFPAVQLAWTQNADAVEIDVHISADDEVVVIHDATTGKTCNADLEVRRTRFQQLRNVDVNWTKDDQWANTKLSTLSEIATTIPETKRLIIELKFPLELTASFIRAAQSLPAAQCEFIGFDLATMTKVKSALPDHKAGLVAEIPPESQLNPFLPSLIKQAQEAQLDYIDLNVDAPLSTEAVTNIHSHGLQLLIWTCDSPQRARALAEMGIDGLTTNRPGWMRQQLAQ